MTRLDQTLEDIEFCIETLGMDDDQIEEVMDITGGLGIRPEYFSDEFIFLTGRGMDEDSQLHDPDYLNIAVFNGMYF